MTLNLEAKKILLRKIPHGLFICGVKNEDTKKLMVLQLAGLHKDHLHLL